MSETGPAALEATLAERQAMRAPRKVQASAIFSARTAKGLQRD